MKIGDKVRFLSEKGGGVVSGFQGKDVVLVEDEDGFEIPMLMRDVVVIDTDDYNIAKVNTSMPSKPAVTVRKPASLDDDDEEEVEPCDKPITFKAKPVERRGGEMLNLYLSFVPNEVKAISSTSFEAYIVNDSNYYVQVLYMSAEGANWHARFNAVVEPNSKLFVEEFDRSVLNDLERLCLQTIAWKQDKVFALKPALTTEIRLDCTKFYKLHTFQPNEFFRDPNWTLPFVRDDKPVRSVFVNAEELQEALNDSRGTTHEARGTKGDVRGTKGNGQTPQGSHPSTPIVVDLHIDKLLDNTSGLSNADMLLVQMKEFRRVMDENVKRTGQKIVVIHGKGDGVLRKNVLQELKYRYKNCSAQDASFREYGYGATQITVHSEKK